MINVMPTEWTSFLPTWHNPSKPHRVMRLLHRQNTYRRIRKRLKRRAQDCGLRSDTERAEALFQLRTPPGSPNPRFLWCPPELYRLGVPQSYAEAMNWSLKAAKQGNPSAQTILGTIYETGVESLRTLFTATRFTGPILFPRSNWQAYARRQSGWR